MALEVQAAVERAARESYGRLVAFLAARSHDVAAAEDALSEAFEAALIHWPETGVPDKPEAWLLVTARRRLIDMARQSSRHQAATPALTIVVEEARQVADSSKLFPDERLKLLFVCAHPAIDAAARTPLMLQTVLGLDAAEIASAFLVKPATMGQRLSRAKAKIRDARIAFEVPEASELAERLESVLEAIYAAYGVGWAGASHADESGSDELAAEAILLGRLLAAQLPDQPEVKGLLALMLYCEARRDARIDAQGRFVPLSQQEVGRWKRPMLVEAHKLLLEAEKLSRIGHFQLEAAIQSAHTRRAFFETETDWEEILLLYEGLVRTAPTIGALVGRAAVAAEARGAQVGLDFLAAIPPALVVNYQAYWAQQAHLLKLAGRPEDARAAYDRAIGLSDNAAMRDFLARQRRALDN